jgi:hypothetical protein
MDDNRNNRETGARHAATKTEAGATEAFSQDAATNRRPPGGLGNAEPLDDHNEKTRHSDGQQPRKMSGAGPALAERSKDAIEQMEENNNG